MPYWGFHTQAICLPHNYAQHSIFHDNDLHGQPVFHQRGEFAHQHGEPTVSDYVDDLATRNGGVQYLKAMDTFMVF